MAVTEKSIIKNWFKNGLIPFEEHFSNWIDSFRHMNDKIPLADVEGIDDALNSKASATVLNQHITGNDAHAALFQLKQSLSEKGEANGYVPLNEIIKISSQFLDIVDDLITGGSTALLSAEQGKVLQGKIDAINLILTSDDVNLDTVQELVDAIKEVETSLQTILVNDLTTGGTTKALTAEMGKFLKALIDALAVAKFDTANISNDIEGDKASTSKVPSVKQVYDFASGAKVPFTAFVDRVNGNDATAEFENSKKPYKTIDAVYLGLSDSIERIINVHIIRGGTYVVNNKIPTGQNTITSNLAVTLDFTGNTNDSLFTKNNGNLTGINFTFNIPFGTIKNSAVSGGFCFHSEQTDMIVNVKAIEWNSPTTIFAFLKSINFQNIETINTKARIKEWGSIIGDLKLSKVTIPLGASSVFNNMTGVVNIGELTINDTSGTAHFTGNCRFKIGNILGTGVFSFIYHNGNTIVEFVNSTITPILRIEQTIGNLTFEGIINSVTLGTSQQYGNGNQGSLTLNNLKIISLINPFRLGSSTPFTVSNCNITTNGVLLRTSGIVTPVVRINNSSVTQTTRTHLIEAVSAYNVDLKIGGLETNALSFGNNAYVVVDYALQSFKDKSNETIIRSKVDLVNKVLSSSMNYIIDGVIDNILSTDRIIVPVGGLSLSGYGFDVSAIKALQANSIIFSSPVGGSGNLFLSNISLEASGGGSKVFNVTNAGAPTGGADAIELNVVNFDNCDSLGELINFRQGLWNNVGVFGVKDGLTLSGTWSGGFRSDLTIVRNFGVAATVSTLFKKGTDLLLKSRFWTDINADFKTSGSLSNFDAVNFATSNLYQIKGAQITRGGVIDDTQNYTGTITAFDNVSDWQGNNGIPNSNQHPYGITTDKMKAFANDADADTGGIKVNEVYIETGTGYFRTRLV